MTFGEATPTDSDLGRQEVRMMFAWRPMRLNNGQLVWWERVVRVREVEMRLEYPCFVYRPMWTHWQTYTLEQFAEGAR